MCAPSGWAGLQLWRWHGHPATGLDVPWGGLDRAGRECAAAGRARLRASAPLRARGFAGGAVPALLESCGSQGRAVNLGAWVVGLPAHPVIFQYWPLLQSGLWGLHVSLNQ